MTVTAIGKGGSLCGFPVMLSSDRDSASLQYSGRQMGRTVIVTVLILSGIGLACIAVYLKTHASARKPNPEIQSTAELISSSGMVLVRTNGRRAEWQEVKAGAALSEGDLIQTDNSGGALVRYSNGITVSIPEQTIFTVRNSSGNLIEISVPPEIDGAENSSPSAGVMKSELSGSSGTAGSQLFLQLQRIVAFGRYLELVGRVEAGTNLTVNDESVEVAGDGTFRHFTTPFPASVHKALLVLKGTDLAGRTRILTATYVFSTGHEEK
jgi:hypothetical protein